MAYGISMIYLERTIRLNELTQGFSLDGEKVEAILQIEQTGSTLSSNLTTFHLAPLSEGRYVCLLTDGKEVLELPIGSSRKKSAISLERPFGAMLLFIHHLLTPVAYGGTEGFVCDKEALLKSLTPVQEEYDDTMLAEENFYPEETDDDTYYQSVKEEVEESFALSPITLAFQDSLPNAVCVETGNAILGKLYSGDKVKYLLFGVKEKTALPKEVREKAYFVPYDFFKPDEGMYFLFQRGTDGKIV